MANNKITFGLRNVHYSIANQNSDGSWSFATPVALPGAQEFSSEIVGGSTSIYADDVLYAKLVQNAGRTLTLKFTEITDEFKINILGYKRTVEGNLVEIANAPVITFALGFQFDGDVKQRRVWYFLCTVNPIGEATKSKTESAEANSVTLTITAQPIEVGDHLITNSVASYGDSNYSSFLTSAPKLPEVNE